MRGVDHWEFEDEKRRKRAELATRVASLPPDPPPGLRPGSADVAAGFFARGGECRFTDEGLGRLRGASGALQESLRVTSGYRRPGSLTPVGPCERCRGERRVLDEAFPHGPRWMGSGPLGEAVALEMDRMWEAAYSPWGRRPIIFDEFRRWRSPWWARAIAWGIAIYYAVGGSRPGTQ